MAHVLHNCQSGRAVVKLNSKANKVRHHKFIACTAMLKHTCNTPGYVYLGLPWPTLVVVWPHRLFHFTSASTQPVATGKQFPDTVL
jgi:hypothetical protein